MPTKNEIQQVAGRNVCNAGQDLVGSHGGRSHAGINGCLNSKFLLAPGSIIQLGYPPNRIDLVTENPAPRASFHRDSRLSSWANGVNRLRDLAEALASPRENGSTQFRRGDHDGQQTHSSHSRGSTWRCRAGAGISHGSQPDKPAVIGLIDVAGLSGGRLVEVAAAGTAARPGDSRVGHVPGDERIGRLVTCWSRAPSRPIAPALGTSAGMRTSSLRRWSSIGG